MEDIIRVRTKRGRPSTLNSQVDKLFDILATHPDGTTFDQISAETGWSYRIFQRIVNKFRDVWSDQDVNLVCHPTGHRGDRWIYLLTSEKKPTEVWTSNRVHDCKVRIKTMRNVMESAVNNSDGRTKAGREARVIHRYLSRLWEDLENLQAQEYFAEEV